MSFPLTNARPNVGNLIEVPREVWTAGSASRAPALGRSAGMVEAIIPAARSLARNSPVLLRRLARGVGPTLGVALLFEAVEWASEWLLEGVIQPLQQWPTQNVGSGGLGWSITYEYDELVFDEWVPRSRTENNAPGSLFPRLFQLLTTPVYETFTSTSGTYTAWGVRFNGLMGNGSTLRLSLFQVQWNTANTRFKRIVSLNWQGVAAGFPAGLMDPLQGAAIQPGAVPAPSAPLSLPIPATPGTVNVPGRLTMRTPVTEGADRDGIDFDWLPNVGATPLALPGLRVGLRPAGAVVQAIWRELAPELADRLLDQILDEVLGGGGDCPDPCPPIDWEQVRPIVQEELDSKFPPRRPTEMESTSYSPANSRTIILPSFPRRAVLTCTQYPENTRYQPGGDNAPDVFYLGWYSVGRGATAGERSPIHYLTQSIPLSPGDTHLSYTYYAGTLGSVVVHYEEEA